MSESLKSSLKTAAKGTTFVFAGMVVSQALWFVMRLLLVRNLSKEDLGIYSLITAIVSILSLLASMGLWQGSTRYISVFLGQGRNKDAEAVHRYSLIISVAAGAGVCALLLFFSRALSSYVFYKPELSLPLMVLSFFIPAYVMAMTIASVLRGYGNIAPTIYFIEVGQPFLFLALICLIFFFNFSLMIVIYAYVFSTMASCALIACYGYRKPVLGPFPRRQGDNHIRELLKFSVPVLSIDVMFLLFRWTDTILLGRYGTAEQVGVYSVGVSLAVLLNLPLVALGLVYMPIAGELYAKKRLPDLAKTYQVLTKWVFSLTLPLFFILFFFPDMTINLLFGDRFGDSVMPLRILSLGYLFTTFMGTNNILLLVFGLSKAVMKVSAAGALLDVLLNYFFIKRLGLGIDGAALATSLSLVAVSLGYSFVLYSHNRIHPISSGYLKPVIGSSVIGILIYAAAKSLPLYFWMLPVYFVLYISGYIASLIFTRSIDDEDFMLFGEILKRIGIAPENARKLMEKIYKKG